MCGGKGGERDEVVVAGARAAVEGYEGALGGGFEVANHFVPGLAGFVFGERRVSERDGAGCDFGCRHGVKIRDVEK